jgi:HEAT repeat protein
MKKCMRLAMAVVVLTAAANAQDGKPQDPDLEKRIQKLLEQKKRDQEQAQKEGAKQGAETPEQSVARAKLLADSEHDYEKALALAESVARDEKVASEVRGRALVVAARSLVQLGRADDAQNRLRVALGFGGPAADEARRLLDAGQTDQQLELRIAKAIEELFGSSNSDGLKFGALDANQTARDLVWVGAPAVPRLAKVLADVDHLANVSGAAYLLGNIGTQDAADAIRAALQRQDPLYRRAVLRAFNAMEPVQLHRSFWDGPVRAAAVCLLSDSDASVRESALKDGFGLMTIDEVLTGTRDPDDAVRIAAWRATHSWLHPGVRPEPDSGVLVAALRRCLKEDRDPVRIAAATVLGDGPVRLSTDGRELAFESMLDPALTGPVVQDLSGWLSSYGVNEAQQTMFRRPLPIDLLVRVAERFDRDARSNEPPASHAAGLSRNALRIWIRNSAAAHVGETDHRGWPASDRAKAWPLVRLGYGTDFLAWINENATREDLPAIVDAAIEAMDAVTIANVVQYKTTAPTDEMRAPIANSILRVLEADRAGLDPEDKFRVERVRRWCGALISLGTEEGDEALIRIAAEPNSRDASIASDLLRRDTPVVQLRNLSKLVTIKIASTSGDDFWKRNDALGRLAAAHSPELPKILATCYELGLNGRSVNIRGSSCIRPRGFAWLVARDFGPDESVASRLDEERRASETSRRTQMRYVAASWNPSYSEAEVREAFEACARVINAGFWDDVRYSVDLLAESGPYDPIATAVLELATRIVPTVPLVNKEREPHPIVGSLLLRRAPGWEELAMTGILDTRWREAILKSLPEVTPNLLDRLSEVHDYEDTKMRKSLVARLSKEKNPAVRARAPDYLKDESGEVRAVAIPATLAVVSERALDLILPLAKDPDSGVRVMLCECLGSVFDRRAIPALVDLLQDPQEDVRKAAKSSLDALQYTFEQKEKWKRVLEGAGLDSTNAAEALVKQAAAGQPKATRLVAIESLGTLGVAETLPVLIQFMGDGDAEVAAAAKEAVARINRQSKAGKDAGDAKAGKDGKPPSDH